MLLAQHYHVKHHTLLLHAGPEIAVASTKAYTAQIAVLSILSQIVAKYHGRETDVDLLRELAKVTTAIETIVDDAPKMEQIATDFLKLLVMHSSLEEQLIIMLV